MLELFEGIKNFLSGLSSNKQHNNISRKRRLSRDLDGFQSKMRRLDDFVMPRCSSPLQDIDTPSSSKYTFKKPSFLSPKPFLRPQEIIDLSDDDDLSEYVSKKYESSQSSNDDWMDQRKKNDYWEKSNFFNRYRAQNDQRHRTALHKSKTTLEKSNEITSRFGFKKPISALNESIRLDDFKKYKEILDGVTRNSNKLFTFNGTDKKSKDEKDKPYSFTELYKKHFNENVAPKVIDLTSENENKTKTISIDSDSDSDVKIVSQSVVSPINSLKKRLEIEPVMNKNFIAEWDSAYTRKIEERKQQIDEYVLQRDKFRDVNKQNTHQRLEEYLKNCRIEKYVILDEDIDETLDLPELTEKHERVISGVLKPGPGQQVFIDKFNLRITRSDLHTLKGLNWLNDEVINFYTNLIAERGNGTNPKLPKVHSMNTFFYPKLVSQGYSALRRWTKKVDIFAQDIIVVPVHLGVHWCLSIIDFRDKTIKYYDSMGGPNPQCLKALLEYLKCEHLDKKKSDYDVSDWKTGSIREIPQQMNGSDCGMFACMYAEFLTRNAKILFTQEHMPYFRKKMVYEIVTGELMMK